MKGQGGAAAVVIIGLLAAGGLAFTSLETNGNQLNALEASSGSPETTVLDYLPVLSSIEECDYGKYDRCIEHSNEFEGAYAVSILTYQSYSNPTTEGSLDYQCVETGANTEAYLLEGERDISNIVNDWETLDAEGENIANEGKIPFTEINDGYTLLCMNKAESGNAWVAAGTTLTNDGFELSEPQEDPQIKTYREADISTTENGIETTVYLENVGGDMDENYLVELQPDQTQAFSFTGRQETCDPDQPENVHKDFRLQEGERTSVTLKSTGLEPGEYDVKLVSTDGCASKDPSTVSKEPFGWGEVVESQVTIERDNPDLVEYRPPEISSGENRVSAEVFIKNEGGDMQERYLVELDPRRTGSLSFLQNFAFTGGQETCDPDNPSVVHKDFQLDAGESTSIELESTGLEEGVYDVVLVSADGCASKDPSVEPVQPYGWSENKGSIEVVAPNRKPSISTVSVPGEVAKGEEFTASVQASDPDGDLLSIEWGNGETGDEASFSFDEVGEETVSVTVSDGEASVSESVTLEVVEGNSAPKIDQVILKDEVPLNEELTAVVDASDPDGDQLSYEWSNGDTGSEASFSFESTGLKTVSVTVTDGDKSVSKSGSVSVVEPEESGIFETVIGFLEGLFPF